MTTLANFQARKISAYAQVILNGETITIDLTRVGLTFSKNAIPFATAEASLGRNTLDGSIAEIHSIVNEMNIYLPIVIYAQVIPGPNSYGMPIETWPAGYFLIFRGYLASLTYTSDTERISINLRAAHWLADLDSSSAITSSTHTLTPQQLNGLAAGGLGEGIGGFFIGDSADEFFTLDNIEKDLWGQAIGPWLMQLCQQDILTDENDDDLLPNTEGLLALRLFEPYTNPAPGQTIGTYIYGMPLSMPVTGLAGAASLSSAIADAFAQEGSDAASFGNATIWQKLLTYGNSFEFTIVPLVNTALIVPQTAGLRLPWQTIYGQEYRHVDFSKVAARPVKGVRLMSGVGATGGPTSFAVAGGPQELAGWYDNPDYPYGLLRYENAPAWFANVVTGSLFAPGAAAPFGLRGDARFPGFGGNAPVNLAAILDSASDLGNAIARTIYIREALRSRTGSLQGKLRFDIAPGSTVQIFCISDQFIQAELGVADTVLIAEVQSVGISLDSESLQASTVFALENIRTTAENSMDSTSVVQHPIYEAGWSGAPLVENTNFESNPNPAVNPAAAAAAQNRRNVFS